MTRQVTVTTTVYKFDELFPESRQKALDHFSETCIYDDWWECTYEDAESIGLGIEEFDTDHRTIKGKLSYSLSESAEAILENHGKGCDTVEIAKRYLAGWAVLVEKYSDGKKKDQVTDENENEYEFDAEADKLEEEFTEEILQEYLSMLTQNVEHLQTEEAIIETIEANDYDFNEDGTLY